MEEHIKIQDNILSKIGLKRKMVWELQKLFPYNKYDFEQYVTPEYRNSERKESDEVYRMFEINLLHTISGLRLTYMTTESYDGETVDYNLHSIFIITLSGEKHEISDIDLKKKIFYAVQKQIPFAEVSLKAE